MLAAAGGQDDLLRLLLRKGAKVNGRQKNGTTALIHAAEKNFLTTVAILLEAGAFVNVQQNNGETALMKVNASLGTCSHRTSHCHCTGTGDQRGQDSLWT